MKYLHNAWYPALWASDIDAGTMLSRTILGEAILVRRAGDGALSAMEDRCPHRLVPLSLGNLQSDGNVRCIYHGLEFDGTGRCVRNPHGDGRIPANLCVKTYAVVQRHSLIWIWMGDKTPDANSIPDFELMDREDGWVRGRDYMKIDANYLLLADNLLDLSHANFLHEGILGYPEHSSAKTDVIQEGPTRIRTRRHMTNVPVAKLHDLLFRRDGKPVDMWNDITWDAPSCMVLTHGLAVPGASGSESFEFHAVHMLVPETHETTHYLYGIVRPPASADEASVKDEVTTTRTHVFHQQDKLVLEAQQRFIGRRDLLDCKPVMISVDAASMRMRRLMGSLIAED